MRRTRAILVVTLSVLAGCATTGANYVPIVDMQGHDPNKFNQDVTECQQYATRTYSEGQGALAGAIVAGLLGALVAPSGSRNYVAGHAAVIGGASGAAQGSLNREVIIKRCLAGRGYNVLN